MSHTNHSLHFLHKVWEMFDELEPLDKEKNPFVALILGFLLGAITLGIYFRSWKDFFICLALCVFIVVVLIPTGPLEALSPFIGNFLCGIYGARRAVTSNERLHLHR